MHFISWDKFSGPRVQEVSVSQSEASVGAVLTNQRAAIAPGPHCMQYPPLWDKSNLSQSLTTIILHLTQWEKRKGYHARYLSVFDLWESSFQKLCIIISVACLPWIAWRTVGDEFSEDSDNQMIAYTLRILKEVHFAFIMKI